MLSKSFIVGLWLCLEGAIGFTVMQPLQVHHHNQQQTLSTRRSGASSELHLTNNNQDSRRSFLNQIAATTAATIAGTFLPASPALAVGGKKKVNAKLSSYGLPPAIIPDGLTPLVQLYGKGKNRFPILVTFSHPPDWVVTLPSNDVNGEDGTIQAGEYAKGDTATFFVYNAPGNIKDIADKGRDFYSECLQKAISQKGANVYQNFKVKTFNIVPDERSGQTYVVCDFKYQLITGAGFEVDRVGVASITSQGNAVEMLWTASTTQRYKKTENILRAMASSFRCYTDGLEFSAELEDAPSNFMGSP